MPDFDFKSKWGALPIWAWGLIAGVVALIGYYIWARRNGASDGNNGATTTGSNIDAMGYQTAGIKGGSATTDTTSVPDNNTSWLSKASTAVANAIAASPSAVYGALYKYITGQDITTQEKSYVDKALTLSMNPPEGVQGISKVIPDVIPTPPIVAPPVTKPPAPHALVGYIRNTAGEISQLYSDNSITPLSAAAFQRVGQPNYNQVPDSVYNSYKRGAEVR